MVYIFEPHSGLPHRYGRDNKSVSYKVSEVSDGYILSALYVEMTEFESGVTSFGPIKLCSVAIMPKQFTSSWERVLYILWQDEMFLLGIGCFHYVH